MLAGVFHRGVLRVINGLAKGKRRALPLVEECQLPNFRLEQYRRASGGNKKGEDHYP